MYVFSIKDENVLEKNNEIWGKVSNAIIKQFEQ